MLKKAISFVLVSVKPVNVPQGYASRLSLTAAALNGLFRTSCVPSLLGLRSASFVLTSLKGSTYRKGTPMGSLRR